jgi:hypothetical protein
MLNRSVSWGGREGAPPTSLLQPLLTNLNCVGTEVSKFRLATYLQPPRTSQKNCEVFLLFYLTAGQ